MAEYKIQGETLTAIADAIRSKVGATAKLTPAQMANYIDAVQLQEKSVTPTDEIQTVTPDDGYYGLSKVLVGAATMSEELPSVLDYSFGTESSGTELGVKATNENAATYNGNNPIEFGYSFQTLDAIVVYGVRVYYSNSATTFKIWDASGNKLYEHAIGSHTSWTDIMFDAPVNLVAGSTYTVSMNKLSKYQRNTDAKFTFSSRLTSAKAVFGSTLDARPTTATNDYYTFGFYIGNAVVDSQPEEYEVTRGTMDGLATEVMRISGTSEKMTVAQMTSTLASLVGDVLPDVEVVKF